MATQRITLAGATSNLGILILSALFNAGYSATVLSRFNSDSASRLPSHPKLKVVHVDLGNASSLTTALTGIQVVVFCLATAALGVQNSLIDAAVASGVRRFIPAEFGMDSQNALAMCLSVCIPKDLETGFVLDMKKQKARLYNGGDVWFSATLLDDVAKAVLGVVGKQEETKNRVVYVHSALVTQNQLIQYAKDKDGKEWDTMVEETETVTNESYAELEKGEQGDVERALLGFCIVAMFDEGYGCGFSGKLDNEVVGVKGLSDCEVRKVVESYL